MHKSGFPFTPNDEANELLAADGTALLIGLCLEQQVRSEKAMMGPFVLRERLGHLDAAKIARTPPAKLDRAFRQKPALHRFPGMMAKRVRALCALIAHEYGNDGSRLWGGQTDAEPLYERFKALPGFGEDKAACAVRIMAKYGKQRLRGWQRYASDEDLPWEFLGGKRLS
ncbi:MAG: hypothetical protein DLM53_09210 [Candidatus Eremiobacter antarcticus]|nr:hypothetical protein [Candidatus Eremiobacteraeota bacterium]MBC5807551.1 hypothetical protein [Candidatus Eremiobacteraeota bacterium]PZR61398.1 MAG: hypothetical protein DLM53_09210 [Candidatus Eremiobacter sp. RRmetagenome_bin22]